jgi:hypothetical protein
MRQLILAAIALLIGTSSSLAQGRRGTPREQQACTRDAQRFAVSSWATTTRCSNVCRKIA